MILVSSVLVGGDANDDEATEVKKNLLMIRFCFV